jgi:AraC-like DNA-binding protein
VVRRRLTDKLSIKFQHIETHPHLKNYIERMWIFQTGGRMPIDEMKLVVPNGNLKLTISYKSGVVASINDKNFFSREHQITLTGLIDVPVILDTENDIETETLGTEFKPQGVYRFFHFNLNEIKNQIYSLEDLIGKTGKELAEQIANTFSVQQKLIIIQQFLLNQLSVHSEDEIFEYCVEKIKASNGQITIQELEKNTGYSSRWLNMKFNDKLGVSPKNLSSIIRFNSFYQSYILGIDESLFKNDYYHLFYDQSHFIKNFKRFTGLTPSKIEKQKNEFSKNYIKK